MPWRAWAPQARGSRRSSRAPVVRRGHHPQRAKQRVLRTADVATHRLHTAQVVHGFGGYHLAWHQQRNARRVRRDELRADAAYGQLEGHLLAGSEEGLARGEPRLGQRCGRSQRQHVHSARGPTGAPP